MSDTNDQIQHLRELLYIHNRNLRLLEKQITMFGELYAPVHIINQVDQEKKAILDIEKKILEYNSPKIIFDNNIYHSEIRTINQMVIDEVSQKSIDQSLHREIIESFFEKLDLQIKKYIFIDNNTIVFIVNSSPIHINLPLEFPVIIVFNQNINQRSINEFIKIPEKIKLNYNFGLVLSPDCFNLKDNNVSYSIVQNMINSLIRPSMKTDLIVIGPSMLDKLFKSVDPRIDLLSIILREIELTRVSPFMAGGAITDFMFFGREGELKSIAEVISKTSVAITCGRRIGKTTLLQRLAKVVLPARKYTCYFLNCQTVHNYGDLYTEMINSWYTPDIPFNSYDPNSFIHVTKYLTNNQEPPIFLLDEIDELYKYDYKNEQKLFKQFRALSLAGKARFIVTGERLVQASLQDADSPMFNFFGLSVRLSFLELSAVNKLVIEPLSEIQIQFDDPLGTTDIIYRYTSGHPYLVQRLCQGVVEAISKQGVRVITTDHVELVLSDRSYQEDYFSTVWGQAPRLARIITMIVSDGMTMEDVKKILQHYGITLTLKIIKNALDILDLYSVIIRKQGRYYFIATAFPDMLRRSYGDDLETNIMLQCEEYEWEQLDSNVQEH